MTVKIKHNKAHVLYKALGYDHCIIENIAVKMEFCGTFNFLQGFRLVISWRMCCTYMLVLNFRGAQAECTDGRRAHQTTCALIQSSVYQSLMLKDPEIKKLIL